MTKMKQMTKFFTLVLVMVAFSAATFAQVSATANAHATVLAPLTITAVTPLEFGTLASSAAGTVAITTGSVRSATGGVTLMGGTPTAAEFDIVGTGSANYTVTLPTLPVVLTGSVSGTMNVTALTTTIPAGANTLPVGGTATLLMGGTLTVGAAQPAGSYTNATDLTVTVNYQ